MVTKLSSPWAFRRVVMTVVAVVIAPFFAASLLWHDRWSEQVGQATWSTAPSRSILSICLPLPFVVGMQATRCPCVSGTINRDTRIRRKKWQKKALRLTELIPFWPSGNAQSSGARPATRLSLGHGQNPRLPRAPVSGATSASPEPRSQTQPAPRPSPGLERN